MSEYIEAQRNIHRIMTTELSHCFSKLSGVRTTKPEGSFYFFADFNDLKAKINAKGMKDSHDVANALLDHPHHVATVSGAALVMPPENLTFRIAAVDYDGKAALAAYLEKPPKTTEEEVAFVETNTVRLLSGIDILRNWIASL